VAMSAFASRVAAKMRGKDGSARDGQHVLLESPPFDCRWSCGFANGFSSPTYVSRIQVENAV
jgi:hypothetical protein